MTAIKPTTSSSTDTPRRSRAHPPLHSSPPTLVNQQQPLPSSASPSPPISSFSPPPSPSTVPLALTLTLPHHTTTTFTNNNDNDTTTTTTTSQAPNNTHSTYNNSNHTHHLPHQTSRQDHRTRSSKNNNNNHIHSHHRYNHHHHNSPANTSNSSNYSRRIHVRRHSASAYYSGPADHDRVVRTANAHAQAAASGILSPRLRNSRLLLSPKGPQPQRHLLRQQRQQQQQLRRYQQQQQQQQQLSQPFIFDLLHQSHRQQQQEQVQVQAQEQEEQHYHTSRRGSSFSIALPSISPSSSVSVVSPLVLHRASSMPLVHTRSLERQDQEEAISLALRQSQPLPLQPPFYRLLQQIPQSRRQQQQQRKQDLALEANGQDRPLDEPPPDPRLITQRLLQWQEQQKHRKRQEEQRQMQAFRIKKFSDSNTDLDYRPVATAITTFKEGYQEHWGGPIVEHQQDELEDGKRHSRRSSIQQVDHDVDLAGSNNEHDNNNLWDERQQQQRQLTQEQDMMETDSVMETDRTGDGNGDEDMDPQTRLQLARKAKEDAMKEYQEAGRNLQRAQEREEAILFENEMIEVEVGSSVNCPAGQRHTVDHQRDSTCGHGTNTIATSVGAYRICLKADPDTNGDYNNSNDREPGPESDEGRKIKSEELDEPFFKKHVPGGGGGGVAGSASDCKRWRGPKYKDYDISIVIPSSAGTSDVGMSGQPESSNSQERREQARKSERRLPDLWRSPTPMPRSMQVKREATTSRQQGMFWESTRPPLRFGPGSAKVAPIDLFEGRGGYSQQRNQHRQRGSSSSRPALLPPRSSIPKPRPYPPPAISPTRRASQAQTQAPVGGNLPSNFFARGMPVRPPPPRPSSSSPSSQQQRGQGQGHGRSSPMMAPPANQSAAASAFATAAASAFTGPRPAAPTPRYANNPSHPHTQGQPAWRLPEFMDENGHPYPAVVFYTHIDRVDNFYHQHYPSSTGSRSRDVSLSPRSARTSPYLFARRSGGERMENVGGSEEYEDMAMEGEYHHHQRQGRSRTTSHQADRDEREEENRSERKPRAKSESPQL
ncbi:hypothetical protein K457DRAFT_128372 [Linnemannia elongata AG-77]|uniref:Uncharacterized protein n=1 Tax=Linnemannia elongata AG-77 TaxID=1314771 RepID=A0A197JME0_9FUNG|nr:hypothetical protein K457DRAFT_128372 [Linnemannia elongata AG-77]